MKKQFYLFFVIPFLLTGCEKKEKVPLFHSPNSTQVINNEKEYLVNKIYEDEFDSMIESKMSFPLFVYAAGCGTCDNFSIVLKDYIRQTNVIFPYMTLSVYHLSKCDKPSLSTSSLLFYKDGKLVKVYDDILDRVFSTSDFFKIMNEWSYDTKINYLSATYTYTNSTVPFYSYRFSKTCNDPFEDTDETYLPSFHIEKDQTILALFSSDYTYSSLYQELFQNQYDAFINVEAEKEDSIEKIKENLKCDADQPFLRLTYKNGSLQKQEPVELS